MTDVFTKSKRSRIMSRIKGKNTKPELIVRKMLHGMGYRYRLHHPGLPGKPDIVLSRHKKIVMVNGCFWHGHKNCKRAKLPTTNKGFWKEKISKNITRDAANLEKLRELGWSILVVWSCEIGDTEALEARLADFMLNRGNDSNEKL